MRRTIINLIWLNEDIGAMHIIAKAIHRPITIKTAIFKPLLNPRFWIPEIETVSLAGIFHGGRFIVVENCAFFTHDRTRI